MLIQFTVGITVIFVCIVLQSALVVLGFVRLQRWRQTKTRRISVMRASVIVGVAALWLMMVHAVSIAVWAVTYYSLGIFEDWDTAIYFSAVAFTTLGFGDVIPDIEWRQLAGMCAAHGLLIFGVSSAALVEVFRQSLEVPSEGSN